MEKVKAFVEAGHRVQSSALDPHGHAEENCGAGAKQTRCGRVRFAKSHTIQHECVDISFCAPALEVFELVEAYYMRNPSQRQIDFKWRQR